MYRKMIFFRKILNKNKKVSSSFIRLVGVGDGRELIKILGTNQWGN
jgi:hypothetical protein